LEAIYAALVPVRSCGVTDNRDSRPRLGSLEGPATDKYRQPLKDNALGFRVWVCRWISATSATANGGGYFEYREPLSRLTISFGFDRVPKAVFS